MGTLRLTQPERRFCEAVAHGDSFEGDGETIRAAVIRHLVLGLPLTRYSESEKNIEAVHGRDTSGRIWPTTPVGISIEHARIKGRLVLDNARGEGGGPVGTLAFKRTCFMGGFSGRHAHFSRLCFGDCTFVDENRPQKATLDLADADIDSDLDMPRIKPHEAGGILSLLLTGARIDGSIELAEACLRGPPLTGKLRFSEAPIIGLDLALATINGDLRFLGGGECHGSISARSADIRGDVWLSGARINIGTPDRRALFFQLAKIGGSLMMDGRYDAMRKEEDRLFRRFQADGEINLFSAEVGGSVVIDDFNLKSTGECLRFTRARIAGRLSLARDLVAERPTLEGRIRFDSMKVGSQILIKDVRISNARETEQLDTIDAREVTALHLLMRKVRPIEYVEGSEPPESCLDHLSAVLDNARLERLTVESVRLTGGLRGARLTCGWDAVIGGTFSGDQLAPGSEDGEQVRHTVNLERAVIGGSLDISRLKIPEGSLSLVGATIAQSLRLHGPTTKSRFVAGFVDLTSLSCDMLADNLGRSWGTASRILMNQFTYRRTDAPAVQAMRKPSHRQVADKLAARQKERGWPWTWFWLPTRLRGPEEELWEPWQLRRNWLYRQFLKPGRDEASLQNHLVADDEYWPQPFCQATEVAHKEGEETMAINLEIVRQKIEWRLFNRRVRWPLAFIGIVVATGWLFYKTPDHSGFSILFTLAMLAMVLTMMLFIDPLWRWLKRQLGGSRWRPMVALWLCFIAPPLALLALWWDNPRHYLVAMFIFIVLRLTSWFAHIGMRFMFGYLRRPIRAVATLILAFIVGWWGVWFANERGMMVVDHEAAATLTDGQETLVARGGGAPTKLPCGDEISEPIYALDVLIPLLDLREEARCKMDRTSTLPPEPREAVPAPDSGFPGLWEARAALTVDDPHFWAVLKVIYAIAGWIIISLSILTFAHITRTRFGRSEGG